MKQEQRNSILGLLSAVACLSLTACASNQAPDEKDAAYERPEYTTGSNLARKDRNALNVKLVDKDAYQSSLSGNSGTAQGAKN